MLRQIGSRGVICECWWRSFLKNDRYGYSQQAPQGLGGKMADNGEKSELGALDVTGIMVLLPHRYPFLMIDKVIEMDRDLSAIGVKNVTINEPYFAGHFPGKPIMPGVLLLEAMAQTAGALVINHDDRREGAKLVYFMAIDKARFRQPVGPGDTVHFHLKQLRKRGSVWKYKGEAMVDGKLVAEAELTAMIADGES